MLNIPPDIQTRFVALLEKRAVSSIQHNFYKKWLRYYLDFCAKYRFPDSSSKSLTQFLTKLREKKQTEAQIKQAAHAVSLYLDIAKRLKSASTTETGRVPAQSPAVASTPASAVDQTAWDRAIADLVAVIKTRHYSPKTLKPYGHWVQKFRGFKKDRAPSSLRTEDVKAFLSYLTVTCNVSASSQAASIFLKLMS